MYIIHPPRPVDTPPGALEVMSARLNQVLSENEVLKRNQGKTMIKEVIVNKAVDNPVLVEKIATLKQQVEALEKARLAGQAAIKMPHTARIIEKVVDREVEKLIEKMPQWALWVAAVGIPALFSIGCLVGHYAWKP